MAYQHIDTIDILMQHRKKEIQFWHNVTKYLNFTYTVLIRIRLIIKKNITLKCLTKICVLNLQYVVKLIDLPAG